MGHSLPRRRNLNTQTRSTLQHLCFSNSPFFCVIIAVSGDMPAEENVILLSDNEAKLIRKDVDHLVQNIKDNLKLNYEAVAFEKGGGLQGSSSSSRKSKSYLTSAARSSRASPYTVPVKGGKCDCEEGVRGGSWAARKRYPSLSANGKQKLDLEDPLEMLHELISEGNLLKEAVRRLQLGLTPKIQRNFYDSDEDCRTPPATQYPELCGFN